VFFQISFNVKDSFVVPPRNDVTARKNDEAVYSHFILDMTLG